MKKLYYGDNLEVLRKYIKDDSIDCRRLKRRITYIVLSLIFLLIHFNSFGQKQKPKNDPWYDDKLLHFGFSLGVNTMDFNITPSIKFMDPPYPDSIFLNPEVSKLKPGFNIQIITNLRVAKYFDIRFLPGIAFGQRTVKYYTVKYYYEDGLYKMKVWGDSHWGDSQILNPAFLEFPLLLKFKGDRLNNVRPYVIGGLNYRYDLAGKKVFDGNPPYIRLKKLVPYYELGAGLDFYLKYFKLSVEMKMSNGIGDVFVMERDPVHPQYSEAIDKMKSQIWILTFHFE